MRNIFAQKMISKNLLINVIKRHYPIIANHESPYLELLRLVMIKQINLVIDWIRVGFIHGVMNTDNMTISERQLIKTLRIFKYI